MPTLVFWIDVDNTLLANDDVKEDLNEHLQVEVGQKLAARYWEIYEQVRHERGVVDIPLALTRFRAETPFTEMGEQTYEHVHSLFDNYPFYKALYPHALETLQYLRMLGLTVIVSDGDFCYQAEKIVNSHLANAVEGRVLLYTHKQDNLDDIMKQYPADHYALIDDKPDILADVKAALGDRLTTVLVRQGKYAAQPLPEHFTPDLTAEHIGDVRNYSAAQFLHPHQ
jgi:phosphoglycolate phosphatase-like HAD superfamily hydrolase